jgi:hypothetical protein
MQMTVLQRGLSRPATISKQGPGSPKKPGAPSIPQSHRGMGGKPRTSCERIASVCLSPRIRMTCHPEHLYSHLQVTAEMNIPHGKAPRRGRRRIAQDKRSAVLGTRPKFPRALGGAAKRPWVYPERTRPQMHFNLGEVSRRICFYPSAGQGSVPHSMNPF